MAKTEADKDWSQAAFLCARIEEDAGKVRDLADAYAARIAELEAELENEREKERSVAHGEEA